ncbi:hypothetical protein AJ79_00683 [Helicocarpus griseus UAMH5409]|uniref:Uncharacterized protein n=1 Tax=Helicocarpus griseus UAMH5409 TaxID=1447875 RepID=A0A2B7Y971_9EURO|nr:hypothetical protein AJ79_00683 [Helicocarpus griseus UAMH5409]
MAKAAPSSTEPHIPFPSLMNGYYRWKPYPVRTILLCGSHKREHLYTAQLHMGLSGRSPLKFKPGVILYNGTSNNKPILAATGWKSGLASEFYMFDANSVVYMPPVEVSGDGEVGKKMVKEYMRATTRAPEDGYSGAKDGVAFQFSIEVGEARRRERFEWRKLRKEDGETDDAVQDAEARAGGFKLVRLYRREDDGPLGGGQDEPSAISASGGGGPELQTETVAVLAWTKGSSWFVHAFSLRLGNGQSNTETLGKRWALMAVITALRIWMLHSAGETSRGFIRTGEKLRGE